MWQRWSLVEQIFTSVVSRARGNTRKRQTGPPRICGAFQWYFAWQRVNLRLRKLDGEAFRRTESVNLTKIQRSAALEIELTQPVRKTPLQTKVSEVLRKSVALVRSWRGFVYCNLDTFARYEVHEVSKRPSGVQNALGQ